jgi:hypothetical protein
VDIKELPEQIDTSTYSKFSKLHFDSDAFFFFNNSNNYLLDYGKFGGTRLFGFYIIQNI